MDEIDYQCGEEDSPELLAAKLRAAFRDEAYELLAELENALLALEENPSDHELVNRVFRSLHTIKGSGGACAFENISRFAHEVETVYDFVRNGKLTATKQIIDLTLMARDQIKAMFDEYYHQRPADTSKTGRIISRLSELLHAPDEADCSETTYKRLGDILLERGDISAEDLQKALRLGKRLGEALVETGAVAPGKVESALAEQQHIKEIQKGRLKSEEITSIRVATVKLDDLVNLVGELVTVQARLSQLAFSQGSTSLLSVAEEVERLTGELREKTMSVRMLPIGTIFGKFRRLVRDLSRELGKEVELVAEGAETELDKTVIERLNDPLVHLIRNSIDHGIEAPSERERTGKERRGRIRLSAVHSGAHVLIRIEDDGKGLDVEAIRARAVEQGLTASDAALTDEDVYALVFSPGFSTAKQVTGVSGRGVGLDVVKKAIEALRGSIEVESKQGGGAAITLKLPLTMAIIDGLLVRIGPERFVIPLSLVKECVELTARDRRKGHGRNIANVRGTVVPYIDLRERFGVSGERPAIEQIVITESGMTRTGFVVDSVIGGHQTVIKNLGTFYRNVEGVSGATILGDGAVALILDIPKLVQLVELAEA